MYKANIVVGEMSYNAFDEHDCSTSRTQSRVFDGKFCNKIDIKVRIVKSENVTESEIENFRNLSSHPNVQRLFGHAFNDSIHYFALQTFDVTLKEFMEVPKDKRVEIDLFSIIKDITEGLEFLHDSKIVHGNISYSNIGIDYKSKRAILCNCGFDNLRDGIFVTPEELIYNDLSFESDVFNLGVLIFYILSNGKHPFDSFQKTNATIKKIKDPLDSIIDIRHFDTIISYKYKFKAECAVSMLKGLLQKNPYERVRCDETLLDNPFFWNNHEIYELLKRVGTTWAEASDDDQQDIIGQGNFYFLVSDTENKLKNYREMNFIKNENIIELIKFIASKIKHYEDEYFTETFYHEHIFYYLNEFPDLLTNVYMIDDNVFNQTASESTDEFKSNIEEKSTLANIFSKANLPLSYLIPSESIEEISLIKRSNAHVYRGNFNGTNVAIKKIEKEKFHTREIKSHVKLNQRKMSADPICKSCKMNDCENVIKFFGCYEDKNHYCIVLEEAEQDLSSKKYKRDEKMKFLFDAVKGLECLHANNISHLDIKPQNILVVKRDGKLIGCLADFGESVGAIKKTFTQTDIRITPGYYAPELFNIAKHKSRRTIGQKSRSAAINFSKCDIYSLGMIIMKDLIGIKTDSIRISPSLSLNNLRLQGKINLESEQLPIYMTEEEATRRPDAEGVRKNPFFWSIEKKFEFLKAVDEYGRRHETNQKRKKLIIKETRKRLFVIEASNKSSWLDFIQNELEIHAEIDEYLQSENKDSNSIFDLIELIILILTPDSTIFFKRTKSILLEENPKNRPTSLQNYLNFWFKKFEIIGFLYYFMQDDLKILYPQFYSVDSPKRLFYLKKILTIDEDNRTKSLHRITRTISR